MSEFFGHLHKKARDHSRTPIQWDASKHAGFTTGTPWMRVNSDYPNWNASLQIPDDGSVLSYWKQVLKLRKRYKDVLVYGDFEVIDREHPKLFIYRRIHKNEQALVILNFSKQTVKWDAPADREEVEKLVRQQFVRLHTYDEAWVQDGKVELRPFEAVIFVD